MRAGLAPHLSIVAERLRRPPAQVTQSTLDDWLRNLLARRNAFGITRVGSVTRLDRIGIPMVQVARPLALSNAVSQGKGLCWSTAAASGLMESVECWAGERIPEGRSRQASFDEMGSETRALFEPWLAHDAPGQWERLPLAWLQGWDLFAARAIPVPTALVDTVFTLPSSHPPLFPRTTTGLGAGRSLTEAIAQAGLEILERDAIARARRDERFFDTCRIDPTTIRGSTCSDLLMRIADAGLLCGLWQAPADHGLPVYWCHLMEPEGHDELVPLPSEGFGCDPDHERAIVKATLEACQARATAISGAREDLTWLHYPRAHDRGHLADWREQLAAPRRLRLIPRETARAPLPLEGRLDLVLGALHLAGAKAAIVVPLFADDANEIHVVRMIAPPLRLDPRR